MKEEIATVDREEIKKREVKEQEAPHFTVRDKRFWVEKEEGEEGVKPEERLPTYVEQLKNQAEESERKLKEYIDWILSAEGQKLVTEVGYFPIK